MRAGAMEHLLATIGELTANQRDPLLILVSVQDETKYGMLLRVSNDWGKSWRDRDCWTCDW